MYLAAAYANDYKLMDGVLYGTLQPRQPTGADIPNAAYKPVSLNYFQKLDAAAFRSQAFAAIVFAASIGGTIPLPGYEFTAADGTTRYKIISADPYPAGSGYNCLMKLIQ